MRVPYLNKRIRAEFESFLGELCLQVSQSAAGAKESPEAFSAYRALVPLFLMLRKLEDASIGLDPSRALLLDQMRMSGNKEAFLEVVWARPFSHEVRQALDVARRNLRVTTFLAELWSDSLLCLNSFVTKNYRGVNIALRCMLEDLYRHLYFKDHPQEYHDLRSNPEAADEFKISPSGLREYLPKTTFLRAFASHSLAMKPKESGDERDLFDLSQDLYAQTSGYVHGARMLEMNAFKSNASFITNKQKEERLVSTIKDFVSLATAFLAAAHVNEFRAFDDYEKSIVFEAFDQDQKHGLRQILNV